MNAEERTETSRKGGDAEGVWDEVLRAIRRHGRRLAGYPGVILVQPGYRFRHARPTGERVISVGVLDKDPELLLSAKDRLPTAVDGVPVDVRPASLDEQLEAWEASGAPEPLHAAGLAVERLAVGHGVVRDQPPAEGEPEPATAPLRRGGSAWVPYVPPTTPLAAVEENMTLILNSGPDSGFSQLQAFFRRTRKRLTATMYEFTARHIYDALLAALPAPRTLELVMDFQPEGPFSNDEIAEELQRRLGDRFTFAWAAVLRDNVTTKSWIRTDYHLKTAVRDGRELWLSSGNWKPSSQPKDDPADLATPAQRRALQTRSNREWHVVARSPGLAQLFELYIRHDLTQAAAVQRRPSRLARQPRPDVWVPLDRAVARAAADPQFFPPRTIRGRIRVQPLLTPDNFLDHVEPLIRGARRRLYIENQALRAASPASPHGRLFRLVADRTHEPDLDMKILLRGEYAMEKMYNQLKDAGADMARVRFLDGVHTKGILVDDTAVVVGSHNLTAIGVTSNRDASLVIYDPRAVAFYEELFLYDWSRAGPARTPPRRSPRLAVPGEATPPGMVRMTWAEFVDQ